MLLRRSIAQRLFGLTSSPWLWRNAAQSDSRLADAKRLSAEAAGRATAVMISPGFISFSTSGVSAASTAMSPG
jgi:hypothetical protein